MNPLIVFGAKYLFAAVVLGAVIPVFALPRERRVEYIVSAVLGGVIAFALTKLAGMLYVDPRPFTHGVPALIAHEPDNGFPSDHTVLRFTAALLTLRTSARLAVGLLLAAVLVGLCRVLSGVHEPIDVIAGALLGAASAALGTWLAMALPIRSRSLERP